MKKSSENNFTLILRSIVLEQNHLTITEAAKRLQIGRVALSFLLNGRSDLSLPLAVKIEEVFRYNAGDLLHRQVDSKLDSYVLENFI